MLLPMGSTQKSHILFHRDPHLIRGFMNGINLIMCMKDQQKHFRFIGVLLLFFGHQRVSTTYVAILRVISLRAVLFSFIRDVVIMFLMY